MRFLHTADWHLGKTLRGRSRIDEQKKALAQIADAAIAAQVDAVLIAGDVYDSTMPPPEAEVLAYEFLARLAQAAVPCVLIAGNHDQPKKLAALRPLLESLRLHVRAEVRGPADGGVLELPSRDGRERARIATLPFVPERKIVDAAQLMGHDAAGHQGYAARLGRILDTLCASFTADTVNIVLAHLLVGGSRFGTGERRLDVGEIYAIKPEQLPATAQYVALGHLHRPQEIPGAACRAAYAGSPIELDFGEREQHKRAVLVEAHPRLPATLTDVPITAGRKLRDLAGTLEELERFAGDVGDDWLRVTVRVPAPQPGVEERVRRTLPNALEVRQDWPRDAAATATATTAGDAARDPGQLFAAFYQREQGQAPSLALAALFADLHARAAEEPSA